MRKYPIFLDNLVPAHRPISIITIKFSNDFYHNINISECVHDSLNEFIVIDNTHNIFFPTLGQAINAGIEKASHDLMVIVHEDVVLLPKWQAQFEHSLAALESHTQNWLVLGVVGWNQEGKFRGHLSDPHSYRNSLKNLLFTDVTRIDEQVLVLRKSSGFFLDPNIPSIHHIGRDLPLESMRRGVKSYVLNAPSIHKYANESGEIIQDRHDSPKIRNRRTRIYLADRACSNAYIENKWGIEIEERNIQEEKVHFVSTKLLHHNNTLSLEQKRILESPIIYITKGGAGSRLMSELACDIGLFHGNDLSKAGDSLEMAAPIYRAIMRKYSCQNL
jgi:hypothetical protein